MFEVPSALVAVTLTVPDPAGAVAMILVLLEMEKLVAGVDPKSTTLTAGALKLTPTMVTLVPPRGDPDWGLTVVMVGLPTAKAAPTSTKVRATPRVPRHIAAAMTAFKNLQKATSKEPIQRFDTATLPWTTPAPSPQAPNCRRLPPARELRRQEA